MKKEDKLKIKEFLKDKNKKLLILSRNENRYDAFSEWWRARNWVKVLFNYLIIQLSKFALCMKLRRFEWRLIGVKIGKNVGFAQVDLDALCPDLLSIEDNVMIGWKVRIMCHEFTQHKLRFGRIRIKKNAMIGSFSTLRSGITIGKNSAVCMNSYVNKDIPDNQLWGGVPARKIRDLKEGEI